MIGQVRLLSDIEKLKNTFPRFSIIVGEKGCGKKTICKEIVKTLNLTPIYYGIKIDDIRKAIDDAYTQVTPIAFIIPDADNMSIGAKNSLLKVTEEPPQNAYFILTLQNIDNTLGTIKSRGTVFNLDNYDKDELIQYRVFRGYSNSYDDIIKCFCNTTGEVDELFSYDIDKFYGFANTIVNYIHVPKSGNTFKITKSIKQKEGDEEGFDGKLLLKAVQQLYLQKGIESKKPQYFKASIVTGKACQQFNLSSVNKLGVLDMWIMNVRKELRGI